MYWSAEVKAEVIACDTVAGTRSAKRSIIRERAQTSRLQPPDFSSRSGSGCTGKLSSAR